MFSLLKTNNASGNIRVYKKSENRISKIETNSNNKIFNVQNEMLTAKAPSLPGFITVYKL